MTGLTRYAETGSSIDAIAVRSEGNPVTMMIGRLPCRPATPLHQRQILIARHLEVGKQEVELFPFRGRERRLAIPRRR